MSITDQVGLEADFNRGNPFNYGSAQDLTGENRSTLSIFADPAGIFAQPELPQAPDFMGLAEQEARAAQELARQQVTANRPNEFNPYGSRIWTQDPGNVDRWSLTESLSPEQQGIFDVNQQQQRLNAELGLQAGQQVGDLFGSRFQVGGQAPTYQGQDAPLPTYGENRQRVMEAMMGRVGTDIGRDRETKRAQLIAQGIPVGSEAYNREMEQLDRQLTDARQQAEIAATDQAGREYSSSLAGRAMGNQELMDLYDTSSQTHQQRIRDALLERQTPLNEMNAFRTGSQLEMPQYSGFGQQQLTQPADVTGAAQSQFGAANNAYNAQVAAQNANRSGLLQFGSLFL